MPGIIQSRQAPFPSSQSSIENQWFDRLGTGFIVVYAGSDGQIFEQGLVVVEVLDASQKRIGTLEVYRTPTAVGALHVTSASNLVLTLKSARGAVFEFDVLLRVLRAR